MNLHELIQYVLKDIGPSLGAVWPELSLCAAIVLVLLARMIFPKASGLPYYITFLGTLAALGCLYLNVASWLHVSPGQQFAGAPDPQPIFTGLLVLDSFGIVIRSLLMLFAVLFVTFTRVSGVPNDDDATEFYVMILGATIGLCIMVSANHVLMVFLGIEMASVPCYVLAGILRHRRASSEAALKYAVFGAAAAGVMLYGLSLLTGVLGSAHLPTMAQRLAVWLGQAGDAHHQSTAVVLVLGGLMTMVGLAFKLSAVPFHFWAPDVFEGAPAEVGTFLSIASKAAAVALLTRLALIFSGCLEPATSVVVALAPVRFYLASLIALLAAVTCTFGNLAAYGQTNIKRLLAYSTIAHAGYLMMPVAAAVALAGDVAHPEKTRNAVAALIVYLGVYLFMNFGAFAIVAFVRNARGSESIADYAGMIRRSPAVAVSMAIILFSLVGLPPLAGFSAKFAAFATLLDANMYLLLIIGGLNTVVSLFYYLRVVKVMMLEAEPEKQPAPDIPLFSIPGIYAVVLAGSMLLIFVRWEGLWTIGQVASRALMQWSVGS
ncbi:MAG: NADH-quinone oxidoreductase subunit N [Planctomycetota bacterium]